ncbi:hypothetical protein IWW52_005709 [Coemansia sp. RSA 2704]|nr:hypothetical protein IWW52_005709 [Coemansia sp. RSA 2704]
MRQNYFVEQRQRAIGSTINSQASVLLRSLATGRPVAAVRLELFRELARSRVPAQLPAAPSPFQHAQSF